MGCRVGPGGPWGSDANDCPWFVANSLPAGVERGARSSSWISKTKRLGHRNYGGLVKVNRSNWANAEHALEVANANGNAGSGKGRLNSCTGHGWWLVVGGGKLSPGLHTVALSVTVSRPTVGLFTTRHTARRRALLCRTRSALAALPSGVSFSQHLRHSSPYLPLVLRPQAAQTGGCQGVPACCRSRQRRCRSAAVGSLGIGTVAAK